MSAMTPDDSAVVDVHALNLHPNACDVSAPITLAMDFTPSEPVAAGTWEVTYTVDAVNPADRTLTLGRTAESQLRGGRAEHVHLLGAHADRRVGHPRA